MDPEMVELLRAVKSALVVLYLLSCLGRSSGAREVAEVLDISQETARGYLRKLAEHGLVRRAASHNGYFLTRMGWQLIAPAQADKPRQGAYRPRKNAVNPRLGDSTTTTATPVKELIKEGAVVVVGAESAGIPRQGAELARNWAEKCRSGEVWPALLCAWFKRRRLVGGGEAEQLAAREAANLAALRAEGLGTNHRARRICRLDHVTPQYIAGQARRLRQEHRFAPSLLLFVVASGDPLPRHLEHDGEWEEDSLRYVTGPYADIIQE